MAWVIFFAVAWLVSIAFIPIGRWRQLYQAGVIGMILVYLIDSTLISLGAFSYSGANTAIRGIPLFFWLSCFPGGVLLAHFYPRKILWRFPYVLLATLIFLAMEYVMHLLGYFHYHNWSVIHSFFLNIIGFTTTISIAQWVKGLS